MGSDEVDPLSFQITVVPLNQLSDEIKKLLQGRPGGLLKVQGRIYVIRDQRCLILPDRPEADMVISTFLKSESVFPPARSRDEILRNLLETPMDQISEEELAASGLRHFHHPIVLLFRSDSRMDSSFGHLFEAYVPLDEEDILVPMNECSIVVIKKNPLLSPDDAEEFAQAAIETLEVDGGLTVCCGIGECKSDSLELGRSYQEALAALRTADLYHLSGSVFKFRDLVLERILLSIPREKAQAILKEILNGAFSMLASQEMMETIKVYFDQDLNLSTAARQLYIHRNTLLYRLEKIRKATGLDLRRFKDAVVLKILLSLPSFPEEGNRKERL